MTIDCRRGVVAAGSNAVIGLLLALSVLLVWLKPGRAPIALSVVIATTVLPWRQAWRIAAGTALKPALWWVAAAMGLLLLAQLVAAFEPFAGGRQVSGRLIYVAVLMLLAALVFVLNARTPGHRVWAGLTLVLVVVFLIPFLEEPGRLRRAHGLARVHLDMPWSLFYGFVVVVGVTNYLPSRFGKAAAVVGLAFLLEYLGLSRPEWPEARLAVLGSWVSWLACAGAWVAHWSEDRGPKGRGECERLWFWFRDHWGVVWALRVLERFNREAALANWPVRLTWFGLEPVAASTDGEPSPEVPDTAAATLRGLLRRFAEPERLDQAARTGS